MYALLQALGFAIRVENGLCPLYIKRLHDGKHFYFKKGVRYVNDEDGERLPQRLVEEILYEPDIYEGEYELSAQQVGADGVATPLTNHTISG